MNRICMCFMIRNKVSTNPDHLKTDLLEGYPVCMIDENDCVGTLDDAVNGITAKEFFCVEFQYDKKNDYLKYFDPNGTSRHYMIPINSLSNESGFTIEQIQDPEYSCGLVNGTTWPSNVWEKTEKD